MSINWGDAFVDAMRTTLLTVPGLPTSHCWANTSLVPPADQASIDDALMSWDSEPRENGPDAWIRTTATYRVIVYVPLGEDIYDLSSLVSDIHDVFWHAEIEVNDNPLEVTNVRMNTPPSGDSLYAMMVHITTTFDHPSITEV